MSTELLAAVRKLLLAKSREEGNCLIWTGATNADGYGSMRFANKSWQTHRVSWMIARGDIPAGMCVLHYCDRPPRINIGHLFLGTRVDNNADRDAKGRGRGGSQKGEDHPHCRLSTAAVREIYASDEPLKILAERFCVSASTISSIRLRKRWAHVTGPHKQEVPA